LWALLNSPLILGNDLTNMTDATKAIIKNSDVIAVNQDWGGSQGRLISGAGSDLQVWAKPMSDGSVTVVLLNRSAATASISTTASQIGLGASPAYSLKNLWTGTTSVSTDGNISASVASHGVAMYRIHPAVAIRASSGADHRDSGTPVWAGNWQARVLRRADCTGVKWGGLPERRRSVSPASP
jgi:alpha-galactosidase